MTSEQFGQLALQLLAMAQIPGAQIDAAMAFRDMARNLADGQAEVVAKDREEMVDAIS